jgi:3-phenylpropionate/trans-cinnamate dioxygenase ferredoxin reductase component
VILVVGASLAGVHAAAAIRAAGYTGALAVVGAEPHEPYDRPPLSKQALTLGPDAYPLTLPGPDVRWLLGRTATALEPGAVRLDDGTRLAFDGLVVATGAAPVPFGPAVCLRGLDDARRLRRALDGGARRVVVIGAGFIGAEVAAACRVRDVEVTVVDPVELPLLRACGRLLGSVLAEVHRERGVRLELGHAVASVDEGGVTLDDGRFLAADVVVAGLGARPAMEWLRGTDLRLDDGVVTDHTCLAAPGIVAAGDVCRWPSATFGTLLRVEHWTNAVEQGEYAGRRLLAYLAGQPAPDPYDPVPYLWTEQFGHLVQVLGVPSPDDEVRVVAGDVQERRFVAVHGREGVVRAVVGMDWPGRVRRLRSLVADAAPIAEGVPA